jgi:hypothetical protein
LYALADTIWVLIGDSSVEAVVVVVVVVVVSVVLLVVFKFTLSEALDWSVGYRQWRSVGLGLRLIFYWGEENKLLRRERENEHFVYGYNTLQD